MAREMKDSGIEHVGLIPCSWIMDKMGRVASVITDYVASGSFASLAENVQYLDEPDYAMLVRTADVSKKGHVGKPVYINKHAYNFLSNSNLFGGELILPNIGGIGEIYMVPQLYEKMSLAPNAIMIKTKYNDRFYYYYFASEAGSKSVRDISQSTAQAKFNKTDFRQVKVAVPPLSEQHRIADFLDRKCAEIDSVIANTQRTIEEYKQLKQSIITEAVTKGVRGKRPMKDSGIEWIGEIPEEWVSSRFKYVCQINTEFVDPQTGAFDDLPHIGPGNIEKFTGRLTDYKLVKDEGLISGKYHFYPNELVYGKINPQLGKVAFPQFEGLCSADAYAIHTFENVMRIKYLLFFMLTRPFIDTTILESLRMGMPKINSTDLMKLQVVVPSIKEQDEIIDYIEIKAGEIDSLIDAKQQLLTELESYKKSVIYEYVTGKKEV